MKRACAFLSIMLVILSSIQFNLLAVDDSTFFDYQNYNHGYCPECSSTPCSCAAVKADDYTDIPPEEAANPCPTCNGNMPATNECATCNPNPTPALPNPCDPAPVCGCICGISLWYIGLAIVVVATAGVLIISTGNGSTAHL